MHISFCLSSSSSSFACTRSIHARYDVTHVRCKLIARNRLFADFVTAMQRRLVFFLSCCYRSRRRFQLFTFILTSSKNILSYKMCKMLLLLSPPPTINSSLEIFINKLSRIGD